MASTYVNDLRLNEMATGDQSGSWGTVTNTNLELIAEAFSYGTEAITTNADTHTTTIADGGTDPGRSMFLKYTGTLDSACTITIGPNTVSKLWFIENATSGSQNIIIKQGSGATVTIASGKTKVIYSDGVGSGAKMVDAFAALDVGSMSTGSLSTTGNITFGDSDKAIFGAGSDLEIYHDGTQSFISEQGPSALNILSSTVAMNNPANTENMLTAVENGAVTLYNNGSAKLATTSTGISVTGNIANASGDFTLDVAGDIILDAGGADIHFKDDGTTFVEFDFDTPNFRIKNPVSDGNILLQGVDGGSSINALTLDMSDAGTAIFNHDIKLADNGQIKFGDGTDLRIYHNGTNSYISEEGTGNLNISTNGGELALLTNSGTEYGVRIIQDGAVQVRHNDDTKIETSSSGISVYGTINGGDCRGEIFYMGRDTNDYFASETDKFNWFLDGNEDMRLENDGDLHVDGNVIAYSTTISDERLKKDIVKIDNALDKVSQLNGYTFEYLADGKKSAGVIAQEVEKVMPSAITESTLPLKMGEDDKTEYKTVQYDQLHGLMIEAIKELKAEIEELKAR